MAATVKRRANWAGLAAILIAAAALLWWQGTRQKAGAPADDLPTLTVTVFAAPSRSSWFPVIIQTLGLDRQNGFRLEVKQKPGDVAYAEFASGRDPVCYCVGTAAGARFLEQGADITLLWSVNDAQAVLVTNNPAIRSPRDVMGRRLGADTGTGAYAIAAMLLNRQGVDLSRVRIQSVRGPAAAAQLAMGRVDAIFASPEQGLKLRQDDPNVRIIDLIDKSGWNEMGYGAGIPHMNFGVWRHWVAKPENLDLARRFYRANVEATEFAKANPERAAQIVSEAVPVDREGMVQTLKYEPDAIHVAPMSEYRAPVRMLTTSLLPDAGLLDRPFTDEQLDRLVSDFKP